jgi:hypothetical protein
MWPGGLTNKARAPFQALAGVGKPAGSAAGDTATILVHGPEKHKACRFSAPGARVRAEAEAVAF